MIAQRRIALIGDSVLIEGVRLGLADNPDLAIVHIDPTNCDVVETTKRLAPDLVITDLDTPWGDSLVALLREEPAIQLIGLESATGRLTVLTGRHYVTQTLQDLLQLVQNQAAHAQQTPMAIGTG